jgi:hypothetical protein
MKFAFERRWRAKPVFSLAPSIRKASGLENTQSAFGKQW